MIKDYSIPITFALLVFFSFMTLHFGIKVYTSYELESRRAHFFTTQYSQRDPSGKLWFLIKLDKSHKQFIISDDCIIPLDKPLE